jgi:tetratricopeptide (TPR) repeat protein
MTFWRSWRMATLGVCGLVGTVCPANLFAHDSPEHEIAAINAAMLSAGKSAELLARRATEWRALGDLEKASADLTAALSLDRHSAALLAEFARVEAARQHSATASNAITRALNMTEANVERGALYMLRAEILQEEGLPWLALADCERAFESSEAPLDWYLTRARLQWRCGKMRDALEGLKEGFEKTRSLVLEIEWIEAMIDAGEFKGALERIAPHLERTRWKGAWLIRKARAQVGLNDRSAALENLKSARAEINRRIKADNPDVTLLAERAWAEALLDHREAAREDLRKVHALSAGSAIYLTSVERIERLLGE